MTPMRSSKLKDGRLWTPRRIERARSMRSPTTAAAVRRAGPPAGTLPDKEDLADEVALHEDGVVRTLDLGQRVLERNHRWVHAGLYATGVPLTVRDELDGVAELAGVTK